MTPDKLTILLVEDEEHDVEFLTRALESAGATPVHVAANGEEAVAYLAGRNGHPLPGVIITDLKMPHMGGLELLRWLKANERCRAIPALVLTASTSASDVKAAFENGASGYLVKPVSFDELERIIQSIVDYWSLSRRPKLA